MKKINKLLTDDYETLYWTGFLMADGYLNLKKGKVVCALAGKDKAHLEKLKDYIGGSIHKVASKSGYGSACYRLETCGKAIITQYALKYSFKSKKTYNPPDYLVKNSDLFSCFLIGLIDGDGSIQFKKRHLFPSIRLEMHKTWEPFLKSLLKRWAEISLENCKADVKLTNKNSAYLTINNRKMISHLKAVKNAFNLPVLERKWDKIP